MRFPLPSGRLRALLRTAAPLVAMFLLTGSALISCEGTSDEDSDTPSDGTRPNSAAMGRWTPNTDFDSCTKDFHDTFYVIGPDGKKYPTWHAPTATDPATGRLCSFGHEHGRDPRGSALWESIRSHYAFDANSNGTLDTAERDASGVPFGYASEQLRAYNAANGIASANRDEDHVSYKIAWENGIARTRTVNGQLQTFDLSCDALSVLHQETHSAESYASNLHEVLYAIDCSRGTDSARFGGKVIASAMATFGNPGEFAVEQANNTFTTIRFGTPQPLNSPAGGPERGRVIPVADNVYAAILVPIGQTSDFAAGLTESWYSALALRRSDGTELVYVDPSYAVSSPSRYYDLGRLNAVARSIDLCYIGISATGVVIDDPLNATLIVRQARGPECSAVAPFGPFTPRVNRIDYDDPRSVFNGCRRRVTLGATRISNGGGGTVWYSDPYGRAARAGSFTGGVKQFVSAINNSTAGDIDRVAYGADTDPCLPGSNIHAPN
jgi:hypothetical protein